MRKPFLFKIFMVILISAAVALAGINWYQNHSKPKAIHIHAGFQVYIDNKLQNFSKAEYMKESPCTISGKHEEHVDEQLEKAHLHDRVGNVVHVHRESATWADLFTNIKYKFSENKAIKSFVNGREVKNIFAEKIKAYDSVVIFVGENTDEKGRLEKAVTKKEIQKVESKSESCGT